MASPVAKRARELVDLVRTTLVSEKDLREATIRVCESYKALLPTDYVDWQTDKEAARAWASCGKNQKQIGQKIVLDSFTFVFKDKKGNYVLPDGYSSATEVGELQDVVHLTFHDMMPHTVIFKMMDLKDLNRQNTNAVYVDYERFERIDEYRGRTYFQPLKLDK